MISSSRIQLSVCKQVLGVPSLWKASQFIRPGATTTASPSSSTICRVKKLAGNSPRRAMITEACDISNNHPSRDEATAELCADGARCVTAKELGSAEALVEWLQERSPSGNSLMDEWGRRPGTKRVANLWLELLQGEISLEDARPPLRTVHVACVGIQNALGKRLLESHQEMDDGSIRQRHRPLSEKIKPGEGVEEACVRGVHEELGVRPVSVRRGSYFRQVQERESSSYPGLMTRYVLHYMEVTVDELPATDFSTEENEKLGFCNGAANSNGGVLKAAIGVRKHYWKWVDDPSLAIGF